MRTKEERLEQYLSEEAGRRISAAMRGKAERGVMPGCAPLGYRNAWVNGEKAIVVDPETAPKVRRLFELATKKKMSLRKLAGEAEAMGLTSRNGKRLGPSAVQVILNNPFYAGILCFGSVEKVGRHCRLISRTQFLALKNDKRAK